MDCQSREKTSPFRRWTYTAESGDSSAVLPDGCIDVLVSSLGGAEHAAVHVTEWDFSPRSVHLRAGTILTGYRLRPGATVRMPESKTETFDLSKLEIQIEENTEYDREIGEIIDALGLPGSGVDSLAKQQGVSERTLQRHFKQRLLPAPRFWRQLGRARRAVQALPCRVPLSEIALEYGYSDQAHMTREFARWFGKTPVQIRQNSSIMDDLAQPGLGNWTGDSRPKLVSLV